METGPDFELLKDAYAIIDGIPETAIDLDRLESVRGESPENGTIRSPAGWLAEHPTFAALGLSLSEDGKRLLFHGDAMENESPALVMAPLFRMSPADAEHLFGNRNTYTLGDDSGLSDKRLWQRDVREYLKAHSQLAPDFEDLLDTRGPFAEPVNPAEFRAL